MPLARALRAILLAGTALVPLSAAAQAPDARPELGRVVVGGITIEQDAARTAVTQAQQRGIVEWRRFDVGRDHAVEFRQPDARAVTLNRVEARDPSLIAGRITANGQVVIVNRSGVVFQQGAQVDAAGLVVTAADIADENFLAGRMVFDRPGEPGARVENNGHITVREAGLAALVAPRVVNNGVITARLGRVALAGGEAHTVDLHGDGLFEIEITRPVTVAPAGGGPLVENTGTILAEGGRVRITAAAADRIVQDLVRAGGRIGADTDAATGRTGDVVIAGTGGAIRVQGEVTARGTAPGTRGGVVEVLGNRVLAEPGAVIDVSGGAGGGEIAFGITRQGAAERRLAERTGVAAGARLNASATGAGDGGTVIVHSTHYTAVAGGIAARGGPEGGRGGFVEVSGERGLVLTQAPDVSAPAGAPGLVLVDPVNITIVAADDTRVNVEEGDIPFVGDPFFAFVLGEAAAPDQAFLSADVVAGFLGPLRLEASNDITVAAPIAAGPQSGSLALVAGRDIVVDAQVSGYFTLDFEAGRDILVNAPLVAPGSGTFALTAGRGIRLAADVNVGVVEADLRLSAGAGGVLQTAGAITAGRLFLDSSGDALFPGANGLATLRSADVAGDFFFSNGNTPLRVSTLDDVMVPVTARTIRLRTTDTLTLEPGTELIATGGEAGRITLQAGFVDVPLNQLGGPGGQVISAALVEVAPAAPALVEVGAVEPTPGAFAVSPGLLGAISAGTLRIGGATVDGTLVTTASGIAFVAPTSLFLALGVDGALDLRTGGDVAQGASAPLSVGRLTGGIGGSVLLEDAAGNVVRALGDLSAGGDILIRNTPSAGTMTVLEGTAVTAAGLLRLESLSVTVDGTARAGTVTLLAPISTVRVRGDSAIAVAGDLTIEAALSEIDGLVQASGNVFILTPEEAWITSAGRVIAGADLTIESDTVFAEGLLQAGGRILVFANDFGVIAGRASGGGGMRVAGPFLIFGGSEGEAPFDARGTALQIVLGSGGFAEGALDVRSLLVLGGEGVDMAGTVGGVGGRPAAAIARRADEEGNLLPDPPPFAAFFLLNGCEIGVAACAPRRDLPRPEDLDVPGDPATVLRPPALALVFQPPRDPSEEEEQAAPDIRAGDF